MYTENHRRNPRDDRNNSPFKDTKPFYDINDVMRLTGESLENIKNLVREGKIREFRDADKAFFITSDLIEVFNNVKPRESSRLDLGPAEGLAELMRSLFSPYRVGRTDSIDELKNRSGIWIDHRNRGATLEDLREDIHYSGKALAQVLGSGSPLHSALSIKLCHPEKSGLGDRVDQLGLAACAVAFSIQNPSEFLKELPKMINGNFTSSRLVIDLLVEKALEIGSPKIYGGPASQSLMRCLYKFGEHTFRFREFHQESKYAIKTILDSLSKCALTSGQKLELKKVRAKIPSILQPRESTRPSKNFFFDDLEIDVDPMAKTGIYRTINEDDSEDAAPPNISDGGSDLIAEDGTINFLDEDDHEPIVTDKTKSARPPKPETPPKPPETERSLLTTPELPQSLISRANGELLNTPILTATPNDFAMNWGAHFLQEHDPISKNIEEVASDAQRQTGDILKLVIAKCDDALGTLRDAGIPIGSFKIEPPKSNGLQALSEIIREADAAFKGVFNKLKESGVDATGLIPSEHSSWDNIYQRVQATWSKKNESPAKLVQQQATLLLCEGFDEVKRHIQIHMIPTLAEVEKQVMLALKDRVRSLLEKLG